MYVSWSEAQRSTITFQRVNLFKILPFIYLFIYLGKVRFLVALAALKCVQLRIDGLNSWSSCVCLPSFMQFRGFLYARLHSTGWATSPALDPQIWSNVVFRFFSAICFIWLYQIHVLRNIRNWSSLDGSLSPLQVIS